MRMKEYWDSLTTGKKAKLIFTFLLCVLVLVFAFQNWEAGQLRLVFYTIEIPITLLILISIFIGYSLGLIYMQKKVMNKEKEIKELKSKLKDFLTDQRDSL